MPHGTWNPYPPQMTWGPQSPNSDVLLESQLEQIRSLGRIEAKVEPIPAMQEQVQSNTLRIVRLEDKLDSHIEDCRNKPRRRTSWIKDLGKENWSWLAAIAVVLLQVLFNSMGQPQVAERLGSVSPRQDFGDLSR